MSYSKNKLLFPTTLQIHNLFCCIKNSLLNIIFHLNKYIISFKQIHVFIQTNELFVQEIAYFDSDY